MRGAAGGFGVGILCWLPTTGGSNTRLYFMKMYLAAFAFAALLFGSISQASATTISYNLSGYGQDSVVANNLFESKGLLLSSPTSLITACGGICLSATSGQYTGTVNGQFVNAGSTTGTTATALSFQTVTGNASISLFDSADNLVTVLSGGTLLTYNGTTAIEYFSAHMNYDGFYSESFTTSPVPEPGTWLLLGTGMAAMVGTRVRMRA